MGWWRGLLETEVPEKGGRTLSCYLLNDTRRKFCFLRTGALHILEIVNGAGKLTEVGVTS